MSFDFSLIGVKKNIPKVNFTSYSGLFVAPPKFGKTTTASKFPSSIIVPFEDGTKGQVANVVEQMTSWGDFVAFITKLEENREAIGNNVQTIVLDTVNKAYEMCEPYTLAYLSRLDSKRYKKAGDVPHGQFYPTRDKLFNKEIDRILALGFSILFLSHSKVKTIRPKNGEAYDVYSSTMPDRLEALVNPLVDFILYGERRVVEGEAKRVLITKGNEMSDSGGRVRLDEDIIFDSEDEAMQKYQEKFKERIINLLKEEGITEDFNSISKRQEEEKMQEVKKYIEEKSDKKSLDELKEEVSELVGKLTKEQQTSLKKQMKEHPEIGDIQYKKFDSAEKLQLTIEICKSL